MTLSSAMSAAFFKEVAKKGCVWTIKDRQGTPTSGNTVPFFSSERRAYKLIQQVEGYSHCEPRCLSLEELKERWLPGMMRDGLTVGLNWYGPRATGYNFSLSEVTEYLERALSEEG